MSGSIGMSRNRAWRLTFDMSGGQQQAKPDVGRPLDRRVRRWWTTRPAVAPYGRPAEAHVTRQHPHVHERECVRAHGQRASRKARANWAAVRMPALCLACTEGDDRGLHDEARARELTGKASNDQPQLTAA